MSENIKLGTYKGLKLPKERDITVTEAEINSELEKRLQGMNSHKLKEGGVAENGDTVLIDFTGYLNGEKFQGGEGKGFQLTLGSHTFVPGFEKQLVGAKVGEERDVNITFPANYVPELAGKDVVFKVFIHNIYTEEKPALNDDFVKANFGLESVDALKNSIKQDKIQEKAQEADAIRVDSILHQLLENSVVELDEAEVAAEAKIQEESFLNQGFFTLSKGEFLQSSGFSEQEFDNAMVQNARNVLSVGKLLALVIEAEGITATEAEFAEKLTDTANMYGLNEAQLKEEMGEQGIANLKDELLKEKALDFLFDNAVEE